MSKQTNNDIEAGKSKVAGPRWDLILALVLWTPLIVVHVMTIDRLPYDIDEYRTLYVIGESLPTLMEDRLSRAHQPVYFVTAWALAQVLGSDNIVMVRLMPQVISLIALGFLFVTTRRLLGRYEAVLAVTFCLLSHAYLWVGHNARPSAFLALFLMIMTYLIVTVEDKPRLGRQLLIAAVTLLALFSYNAAIPAVAVMTIGVLFVKPAGRQLFLSLLVPLLLFIPWYLYTRTLYATFDPLGWLNPGSLSQWPAAINRFSFNIGLQGYSKMGPAWFAAVATVWVGVIGLILYGLSRIPRFWVLFSLMWFIQLAVGLFSLVVNERSLMQVDRYFTLTVMIQSIALAAALMALPVRFKGVSLRWLRPTACAMALAAAGVGMVMQFNDGYPPHDMDFVADIRDKAPDAELIYVLQDPRMVYLFGYHLDIETHAITHVYGLESKIKLSHYGVEPAKVGSALEPMPHDNVDRLVIVVRDDEIASDQAPSPAARAMHDKVHELIESYGQVEEVKAASGTLYYLQR